MHRNKTIKTLVYVAADQSIIMNIIHIFVNFCLAKNSNICVLKIDASSQILFSS